MFGTDVEIIEPTVDPLQSPSRRRKKRPWLLIILIAAPLACAFGVWRLRDSFAANSSPIPTVIATATELGAGLPNPNLPAVLANLEVTNMAGTAESLFGALSSSATPGPTFTPTTPTTTPIFLKSNTPTDIYSATPGATQTPRIVTIKVKGDTLLVYITTTPPPPATRYPTYTPWVVITILPGSIVTREVTRQITHDVTRIVTATPTNTPTSTATPTETPTSTSTMSETPTETPTSTSTMSEMPPDTPTATSTTETARPSEPPTP